ncbi:hypothetical protein E2558_05610 [Staphylococcus pragensis]|uniref:Uncharacterized protein n=2 Tax=Staphylococcus TaxID=1279 RepID=A0ABY2KUP0_9STAP|nr:hypothetical protein CD154_08830 [Staphylococcus carnosus]TGA83124.1 hypothetical protein E2554_05930 [Staphylococcus petrasii]TGE12800.1 hypothetical protein E2557_04670 [Staphylococcus petrasii]TGE16936.1 hypothetical protein BJR09_07880 [Staphylococcus petrasii]TGN29147.1 hypothetical protein E2558_05610 [Staphylococcus pragensis]
MVVKLLSNDVRCELCYLVNIIKYFKVHCHCYYTPLESHLS